MRDSQNVLNDYSVICEVCELRGCFLRLGVKWLFWGVTTSPPIASYPTPKKIGGCHAQATPDILLQGVSNVYGETFTVIGALVVEAPLLS